MLKKHLNTRREQGAVNHTTAVYLYGENNMNRAFHLDGVHEYKIRGMQGCGGAGVGGGP